MALVAEPAADVLLPVAVFFGAMAEVLSFLPLTNVDAAVGVVHSALALLNAVNPLSFVGIAARIVLLALAILAAANEVALIIIAVRIGLLAITVPVVVIEFAFENGSLRVDLAPTAMPLPLLPGAEIIRPIRPRKRAKALAPSGRLVNLALISAPILIAHDRAELPFIPDVVRIGADHRVLHRLVLRLVLLLLSHEGLLRCVVAKIFHLVHLLHVMLRLLIHQAQHIGRLVHPDWLPVRNLIIFHALRTLRFAKTYL